MADIDKESIILMSKLAVYDSELGKKDRKKLTYFRHDYIYRQNMWMRFFVICGFAILAAVKVVMIVFSEGFDLITFDYRSEAIKWLVFLIIALGAYSFIGTIKYTWEYERAFARNEAYLRLLDKLERRRTGDVPPPKPEARSKAKAERLPLIPGRGSLKRPVMPRPADETMRIPAAKIKPSEENNLLYHKDDDK